MIPGETGSSMRVTSERISNNPKQNYYEPDDYEPDNKPEIDNAISLLQMTQTYHLPKEGLESERGLISEAILC